MSYKQIKWLILLIPTITVGLWEYIRHTPFLLQYISMDLGNLLSPIIVFIVSVILLAKLFQLLEKIQEELRIEKASKDVLEERERISQELHDGISQSLFLLSVKLDRIGNHDISDQLKEELHRVKGTIHHVNEDVRQAISNLRIEPDVELFPWKQNIKELFESFQSETGILINIDWDYEEDYLSAKEKVELYACVKEALINIRKHTQAKQVWVTFQPNRDGWRCEIIDNGEGFIMEEGNVKKHYGIQIMKKRAMNMGWKLNICRQDEKTTVSIKNEGGA